MQQSQTLTKLQIKQVKSYPGYEDFLGKLITEKAAIKNPIRVLSLSNVKTQDLYKAVPDQILITPTEEVKGDDHPYQPLNGFTLNVNNCEVQNYEKISSFGIFHDMENF